MYKSFIRPILFLLDPETVHHFTFRFIKFTFRMPLVKQITRRYYNLQHPKLKRTVFGLQFPNPVGLAAGFDKDAKLFNALDAFGFGFIEIGTLTPQLQKGNSKKRLFRLKNDKALINRMGFNNEGVCAAVQRLKKYNPKVIIGGNIGKNKTTPNDRALDDYLMCFVALYEVVDYFVVNVSSPNTPDLRALQERKPLEQLLKALQKENKSHKPILLKIAPDLSKLQLLDIIAIVETTKISGVIATNTTISRTDTSDENAREQGGLSGKPLRDKSTEVIKFLADNSQKRFSIIGVGGIHSAEDALEKLAAGADLIQLYTGFIYEGPVLVKQINSVLLGDL